MGKSTRWLLLAVAGIAIFVGGVWATSPPPLWVPTAIVWAKCFGLIELPYVADVSELQLIHHDALDDAEDPPALLAATAKPIPIELSPEEQKAFADGRSPELPQGQAVEVQATRAWLNQGRLELLRSDAKRFLIDAGASPAEFELDPEDTYSATLTRPSKLTPTETGVVLPAGSQVAIALPADQPVVVKQVKRLWGAPLVLPASAGTLDPDVRPSREAAPFVAVRLSAPGLDFDQARDAVRACLWFGDGSAHRLQVASVRSPTLGVAEVQLDLPIERFPWFDWRQSRPANLAVVTADGTYAGMGEFVYNSKLWALVLASALAAVLFVALVSLRNADTAWKPWLMGLFIGEDGQPSLSMFQILLWTMITAWALLYVFFSTGDLLTLTQQVMVLLGFAGAGSLAARWVAAKRPAPTTPLSGPSPPPFWAILESNGQVDLFKVQLFLFTVLIALYVVFRVVDQSAFPELDPEFLLLMGVSNSLYVGSKVAEATPLEVARKHEVDLKVLRVRVENLENEIAELKQQSQVLGQSIAQETDPVKGQQLTEQKDNKEKAIQRKEKELEEARIARDEQEKKYKEALAALPSLATSGSP